MLIITGLALFFTSIYLMYLYHVLASILSAILGFTTLSLGIDMVRE
ncbi:MAG: hypothetical protein J7K21_03530 [Desulfurococcales archaeon]|nr:hypothetical protein [Desulfurococcales archaeon]